MFKLPKTVSAKDIQRNYRAVFDEAKKTKQPIVVLTNNQPDVAIIGADDLSSLHQRLYDLELESALAAINQAKEDERSGNLVDAASLQELL